MNDGEGEIVYIASMNYFVSKTVQNYLALGIRQQAVQLLLHQEREGSEAYLLDKNGIILASSADQLIGSNFSVVINEWPELVCDKITTAVNTEKIELLCLKKDIGSNMTLLVTTDQDMLLEKVKRTPLITSESAAGDTPMIAANSRFVMRNPRFRIMVLLLSLAILNQN